MISQESLREILDYDELTGIFTWKIWMGGFAKAGSVAGSIQKTGYVHIKINGKQVKSHRLAFLYMVGFMPEYVDHVDGNPRNNIWSNLRAANRSQNTQNAKIRSDNKSGVKGVYWHKAVKKWSAQITHRKNKIFLGYFDDIKCAEDAIRKKRIELHGEFANHG